MNEDESPGRLFPLVATPARLGGGFGYFHSGQRRPARTQSFRLSGRAWYQVAVKEV